MDLFFIGFTIDYTINALFFDDDTMHKIYKSNGSYDLAVQIPISIFSSLITMVLNTLLNTFALSNDNIIDFKQNKQKKGVKQRGRNLIFKLKIKSILLCIIIFIFLNFILFIIFLVLYFNVLCYI